jgi:hypothetical protein
MWSDYGERVPVPGETVRLEREPPNFAALHHVSALVISVHDDLVTVRPFDHPESAFIELPVEALQVMEN